MTSPGTCNEGAASRRNRWSSTQWLSVLSLLFATTLEACIISSSTQARLLLWVYFCTASTRHWTHCCISWAVIASEEERGDEKDPALPLHQWGIYSWGTFGNIRCNDYGLVAHVKSTTGPPSCWLNNSLHHQDPVPLHELRRVVYRTLAR